jgi:hypothetical protein
MESKHLFVILTCIFHFIPVLVANAVVDGFELD